MSTDQRGNAGVDYSTALRVSIVRFVDSHQPGFVKAVLRDAWGKEWRFVEKVPVIGVGYIDEGIGITFAAGGAG